MKTDILYEALQEAIENSPIIPPCQTSDPDLWYGNEDDAFATRYKEAKKMCSFCPAIQACAEYALAAQEQHGVWGGLSPSERNALITRHRRGRPRIHVKGY